ncbi:MAG TPA: YqhA family protein [Aggregatilineales bacterium]|nr:YqhA family protein [Aggregatilineales bacterium]
MIKSLLESSRHLILVIVLASLVLTVVAVGWAMWETVQLVITVVTQYKGVSSTLVGFVQLLDVYLVVAVLYIFTVALYELFIDDLNLPGWLQLHNFDELKTVISNMVVLIAAVSFLKLFLEKTDPLATLLYGLALTVVAMALIQYRRHTREDTASDPSHPELSSHE